MENTCNHKECKFYKFMKFKEPAECFNYKESWWTQEKGEPNLVKDCAPTRTIIMVQDLYNRLIGVQKASEQERNAMIKFAQAVNEAKDIVKIEINDNDLQQRIPYDHDI